MATASEASQKIPDITRCSICLETFKEPKILPCIHTFCLQCLAKHCAKNGCTEGIECPLCRETFSLPPGGVESLSNNGFIEMLIEADKITASEKDHAFNKPTPCEICIDSEVEVTSYCIECGQHICDRCSWVHKKSRVSTFHRVVRKSDIPNPVERLKLRDSYCEEHRDDLDLFYCYDCKKSTCCMCMSKHSDHKTSFIGDSTKEFRKLLKDNVDKMSECISGKQKEIDKQEIDIKKFTSNVASTMSEVEEKCDQLVSLIQSHKSQLMEELKQFNDKVVKRMETEKGENERQFLIRESFKRYCQEMMDKGAAGDISSMAPDLHARAEELAKTQDEPECDGLSGVNIKFKPSFSTTESVKTLIGELDLKDGTNVVIECERWDDLDRNQPKDSAKFIDVAVSLFG